jgi:hypothetical protein
MREKDLNLVLSSEEVIAISVGEYRELVASKTMLDMILFGAVRDKNHYPSTEVVKAAAAVRVTYGTAISPEGGEDSAE